MCVPNAVIGSESGSGGDYFGTSELRDFHADLYIVNLDTWNVFL